MLSQGSVQMDMKALPILKKQFGHMCPFLQGFDEGNVTNERAPDSSCCADELPNTPATQGSPPTSCPLHHMITSQVGPRRVARQRPAYRNATPPEISERMASKVQ